MLTSIGPDIWLADGPEVMGAAGFHFPTRMVIVRLPDEAPTPGGGLWVWSPIAGEAALWAEVDALGPVTTLVAPNALHHMALPAWAQRYPKARIYAMPGVGDTHPNLVGLHDLTQMDADTGTDANTDTGLPHRIYPNAIAPEAVFFHALSGTVLVTDILQQMPRGWYRGWRAWVARADLMTGTEPQVPRKFRLATRDKPGARATLHWILDQSPRQVVMAHGTPVTQNAPAFLRRAFRWLRV
ncbi:MAG: DUF4336 domain-containing protein [Paracoccaceae bacterium]